MQSFIGKQSDGIKCDISKELNRQSTETSKKSRIYLSGKLDEKIEDDIIEIVKCEGINNTRNRYEDKEINDYLNSQDQHQRLL